VKLLAGTVHFVMLECSPIRPVCAMDAADRNKEKMKSKALFFMVDSSMV
jgi:hypothetical protein